MKRKHNTKLPRFFFDFPLHVINRILTFFHNTKEYSESLSKRIGYEKLMLIIYICFRLIYKF